MSILRLQSFLEGTWSLERLVIDRRTGQDATMTGMAEWTRISGMELLYAETGTLRIGAHSGVAKRSYRFVFVSAASADIFFDDGRFFYRLDLTTGHAEIGHHCGADAYSGTFEARSGSDFRQQWKVDGPAKDYLSTTVLQRAGENV